MYAWSCRYYILLCFCLNSQVMFVTSNSQLLVDGNPYTGVTDITNNYTNSGNSNKNLSGNFGQENDFNIGCAGDCQSVRTKFMTNKTISSNTNSRTERSVTRRVPRSGHELDSLRVFKYMHYDQFNPSTEHSTNTRKPEEVVISSTQTTTSDRSLIPNSFFSPEDVPVKLADKATTLINHKNVSVYSNRSSPPNGVRTKTIVIDAKDVSSGVSERPRRSPYRSPRPRAALHRIPPRQIPMPQPLPPPMPVQVPLPLPYTQNTPTIDYGGYGQYGSSSYDSPVLGPSVQEDESRNMQRYKKHLPPQNTNRRLPPPPGHRGRRPPPRSRQRPPPPRPRPGSPRGRHPRPPKPQYSYPKDAANIQDILKYFNENDNQLKQHDDPLLLPPPPPPPPQASGDLRGVSIGGSDFSKELQDVQTSLLKDIREFAQRPSLLGSSGSPSPLDSPGYGNPTYGNSASHLSKQRYKAEHEYDDFGYDEPKPKPVRELIKHKEKWRDRESEEMRDTDGKKRTHDRDHRDRHEDKGKGGSHRSPNRDESREKYNNHGYSSSNSDKDSRERERQNYRDRLESEERENLRDRQEKEKSRNKPKIFKSSKINYKELNDGRDSEEDRERERDRERYTERDRDRDRAHSHSSLHKRPSNHPVVLKRPYGNYKPEEYDSEEISRKRQPSDNHYWTREDERNRLRERERDRDREPYASVPRVKAPSVSYRPSQKSYSTSSRDTADSRRHLNGSPEYVEDVVEIHTDSPYRVDVRAQEERERKAHLQKLYLEYLERKMEAEAALTSTIQPVKKQPMRMKIHIYPNEGVHQTEQSKTDIKYLAPPVTSYSHQQPILTSPSRDVSQIYSAFKNVNIPHLHNSQMPMGHSIPAGGTGPQMMVDKNKNVVLHLHVHRRNGFGEMEAGSEVYTSTAKPLTYKEIYDDHQQQNMQPSPEGEQDNKSVSMELPIRDDKIEDVLHTLLQMRQR